jgi:hypothetical protein
MEFLNSISSPGGILAKEGRTTKVLTAVSTHARMRSEPRKLSVPVLSSNTWRGYLAILYAEGGAGDTHIPFHN